MDIISPISGLIAGFLLVYLAIPQMAYLYKMKNLGADKTPQHAQEGIPNLGGVAIFFGAVISTIIATYKYDFLQLKMWIAGAIIFLFSGLKSDILHLQWDKRLLIKLGVSILLVVYGKYHLAFLEGDWEQISFNSLLNYLASIGLFMFLFYIFLVLKRNEIILSILSIILLAAFAVAFYHFQIYKYVVLCFSSIGTLLGFLYYHILGKKNKIGMGETGVLIVGLTISILIFKFCELYFKLQ